MAHVCARLDLVLGTRRILVPETRPYATDAFEDQGTDAVLPRMCKQCTEDNGNVRTSFMSERVELSLCVRRR